MKILFISNKMPNSIITWKESVLSRLSIFSESELRKLLEFADTLDAKVAIIDNVFIQKYPDIDIFSLFTYGVGNNISDELFLHYVEKFLESGDDTYLKKWWFYSNMIRFLEKNTKKLFFILE